MPNRPEISSLSDRARPDIDLAAQLFDELRAKTGDGIGITRASYGEGEQIAHDILRREGEKLGLSIQTDAASNLYLTLSGEVTEGRIIIGSHLDSVPLGGNFDGAAGILCGLSVIAGLVRADIRPPRDITLMAIRAEESTWFAASYIGSRAAFGRLTTDELDQVRRTGDGLPLGTAIDAAGGDSARLRGGESFLDTADIGLFLEPHIEQGPSLVLHDAPVGVVTGIRGSVRHRFATCRGRYAHSGATPRAMRHDAVRATAALVMATEEVWDSAEKNGEDLVVTFGKIATDPAEHAFSKIAGRVDFSLDVRSQSPEKLQRVVQDIGGLVERISKQYSVCFNLGPRTGSRPAAMNGAVIAAMQAACIDLDAASVTMPCGAGHDAAVFAEEGVPTGMLLIRNENGSHNPDEAMEMDDFAVAARVVARICLAPPA